MDLQFLLLPAVIAGALIFAFLNGLNDAANSITTLTVSRAMTPAQAVIMAAAANFAGYLTFGAAIASFIGTNLLPINSITLAGLAAALISANIWGALTSRLGIPASSSHALLGGLIGPAVITSGWTVLLQPGILWTAFFIAAAPAAGFIGSLFFTALITRLFIKSDPRAAKMHFKRLQVIPAFLYSVAHGTNDAQKAMGIIALGLFTGGVYQDFRLESWIVLSCYSAIALGTLTGGWRIVRTLGTRLTRIGPREGFCAQTSSFLALTVTALAGIPVSTTQVISGAIAGSGFPGRPSAFRWSTARAVIWTWLFTIPLTAALSVLVLFLVKSVTGA